MFMGLSTWNIDSSDKHRMDKILKLQHRKSDIFNNCLIIIHNIEYGKCLHDWFTSKAKLTISYDFVSLASFCV